MKTERNAAVVDGYRAGKTLAELAREHSVSRSMIAKILRRTGVERRRRGPRPGAHADRDAQIVALYRNGATLSQVGERYGISKTGVRWILMRDGVTLAPMGPRPTRTPPGA